MDTSRSPRNDIWDDELEHLCSAVGSLFTSDDPDMTLRSAVELARDCIGLVRVSIYTFDHFKHLLWGSWASDSRGTILDEHRVIYALGHTDQDALSRNDSGVAYTIFDNCLIVEHRPDGEEVAARGWVICTPIRCGEEIVGLMFNDAGPTQAPPDEVKQLEAAILCSVLGVALGCFKVRGKRKPPAARRVLMGALQILAREPGADIAVIARQLDTTPQRLRWLFETHLGVPIAEYRNQLRFDRVAVLIAKRGMSLPEAIRAAGFEDHAHFALMLQAFRSWGFAKALPN